ncbi:MAG: MEDS domain-containing protein [Kofleriaceae bacterium]
MDDLARHQCLIYDGPPSRSLPALVSMIRQRIVGGWRCMYFNSPAMVAGLRSGLAASGLDVEHELAGGRLILAADDSHLVDGKFEIDRMIETLEGSAGQALTDGFAGLYAVGDMTWEFGHEKDFSKLLEYEWRLEQVFRKQPALAGICQYHRDLLPQAALRDAMVSHASLFINETMSQMNPHYVPARSPRDRVPAAMNVVLDEAIAVLLASQKMN